ncbi:unnamed protein product, partial [Brassica oleracea var. botrytis]
PRLKSVSLSAPFVSATITAPFVSAVTATASNRLGSRALHMLCCCSSALRVLWCCGSYFWCVRSVSRGPVFIDLHWKPPHLPSKPLPLHFSSNAAKTCAIDETRLWSEVSEPSSTCPAGCVECSGEILLSSHRMLLMIPELQTLLSVMELLLPTSSVMECSLHIYSSAMEFLLIGCRFTTRMWFQISSISSAIECSTLTLNCRTFSWMWLQILFIATSLKHISIFLLPWLLYLCSCVARSVYGLEDWTTDDALSVLFKGSAFWYQTTSAIVALIKIVYPTLVVVSITGIGSLIVFSMLFGVIPLLRLNVVEIRRHLNNACCLCIMTCFYLLFLCFRLTFMAANLLAVMALLPSFVNNFSFDGE